MIDWLLTTPPWMVLSLVGGGFLAALYKSVAPRRRPDLIFTWLLVTSSLVIGHLLSVVGSLPTWRLGDLHFLPGLVIGGTMVWLARQAQV
jgi:hypothetical protein